MPAKYNSPRNQAFQMHAKSSFASVWRITIKTDTTCMRPTTVHISEEELQPQVIHRLLSTRFARASEPILEAHSSYAVRLSNVTIQPKKHTLLSKNYFNDTLSILLHLSPLASSHSRKAVTLKHINYLSKQF